MAPAAVKTTSGDGATVNDGAKNRHDMTPKKTNASRFAAQVPGSVVVTPTSTSYVVTTHHRTVPARLSAAIGQLSRGDHLKTTAVAQREQRLC